MANDSKQDHLHYHPFEPAGYGAGCSFGIRQLADIALRTMSPAVNNPTTAVNCIEYLQAIFEHLARRTLPSAIHRMHDGTNILVMRYRTFYEYLQVFAEIGPVSTQNARVADALLAALESIATIASQEGQERLPLLENFPAIGSAVLLFLDPGCPGDTLWTEPVARKSIMKKAGAGLHGT